MRQAYGVKPGLLETAILEQDWKRWLERLGESSPRQRQALMAQLHAPDEHEQVLAQIDQTGTAKPGCPHCGAERVVRNGQADGLPRYKCRGCGKTFNALTATLRARLRQRHKWLAQARVQDEGLSVHLAAERLQVSPSTAFRWRHRFLSLAQQAKSARLSGIAEARRDLHPALGQGAAPERACAPSPWWSRQHPGHQRRPCARTGGQGPLGGAAPTSSSGAHPSARSWPRSPRCSPRMRCCAPTAVRPWPLRRAPWASSIRP